MIGKFLINLGNWINTHFPEKVSADEVYIHIRAIELSLHEVTVLKLAHEHSAARVDDLQKSLADLAKKVEGLTTENSALKTAVAMRMRVASSIPMPGR